MTTSPRGIAAFTVDVEEHFHAELVRRQRDGVSRERRVATATGRILDLLERRGIRATFFIVGEVVRDEPDLVRRIHAAGHEIGCHTHTHRTLWTLSPDELRGELRDFRAALEAAVPGARAAGFRAPTFSIDDRTSWALRVLAEEGFEYDSSIVPAKGPLYGCPGAPLGIYRPALDDLRRHDPSGPIVEFPAPVARHLGSSLPVGGGIYLRLLPLGIYRGLFAGVLRKRPAFVYVHPWETDPGTPRAPLPLAARCATYAGIGRMLRKVERLLDAIPFTTMAEAIRLSRNGA